MSRELLHTKRPAAYRASGQYPRLGKFGLGQWLEEHKGSGGANRDALAYYAAGTDKLQWRTMFPTQTTRGMLLRTYPVDITTSQTFNQVQLWHADEIAFNDGTVIGPVDLPDLLIGNITVNGANGLDTGSHQASTWYEHHLIRRSLDGALALLFHRASDFFLDETYTTPDDGSYILRRATGNANTRLAQGFKVDTTGACPFVDAKLVRTGAVAAGKLVWLTLHADSGGLPTGAALATSDKFDASLISTTANFIRFLFRTQASLTAATQYHLVLNGDYTASDTVNISWRADVTAGAYANGSASWANNGTWTAVAADDFLFKVYITRTYGALTMPGTPAYDQSCLLGYGYRDSGSSFIPFVALDRLHKPVPDTGLNTGAITATTPTLIDLSAVLPPATVLSHWLAGTQASPARFAMAGVPDGYRLLVDNLAGGAGQIVEGSILDDLPNVGLGPILTEAQAVYALVSASTGTGWLSAWEW